MLGNIVWFTIFFGLPVIGAASVVYLVSSAEPARTDGWTVPAVVGAGAAGGVLSALAWLTWQVGYTVYPDGSLQGPYGFWQLVGTAACAAAVCAMAASRARQVWAGALAATAGTTLGYAFTWSAIADHSDGLYVVGMWYLIAGGGLALAAVAAVVATVRTLRFPRPRRATL